MSCCPYFSDVTFVLVCFVFVFLLSLKPRPFVQSFSVLRYACASTATRSYLRTICVLFLFFFLSLEKMPLFPSIFCTISGFSLYEEYVVRSFLSNRVFIPCVHGLDFLHHVICYYVRIQSINIDTDLNCKEGIVGPFGASIGEHVPERLVLLGQINYLISFFFLGFGSVVSGGRVVVSGLSPRRE